MIQAVTPLLTSIANSGTPGELVEAIHGQYQCSQVVQNARRFLESEGSDELVEMGRETLADLSDLHGALCSSLTRFWRQTSVNGNETIPNRLAEINGSKSSYGLSDEEVLVFNYARTRGNGMTFLGKYQPFKQPAASLAEVGVIPEGKVIRAESAAYQLVSRSSTTKGVEEVINMLAKLIMAIVPMVLNGPGGSVISAATTNYFLPFVATSGREGYDSGYSYDQQASHHRMDFATDLSHLEDLLSRLTAGGETRVDIVAQGQFTELVKFRTKEGREGYCPLSQQNGTATPASAIPSLESGRVIDSLVHMPEHLMVEEKEPSP